MRAESFDILETILVTNLKSVVMHCNLSPKALYVSTRLFFKDKK